MEPAVNSLLEIELKSREIGMAMQVRHDGGSSRMRVKMRDFGGFKCHPLMNIKNMYLRYGD
jgi:hypothetical protein